MAIEYIAPNWPAPRTVRAATSTRAGGTSQDLYASLNIAAHVGDDPEAVRQNRHILCQQLSLPSEPKWLTQVHSDIAIAAEQATPNLQADASFTSQPGIVCAVMTADCLPILLCNRHGTEVAAIHGGWQGLVKGIIPSTILQLQSAPQDLMAWLGPAISGKNLEVDNEVREQFLTKFPQTITAFTAHKDKWLLDIYNVAHQQLNACDVTEIYSEDFCTYEDEKRFYSYRRDGAHTGRMASMIWLTGK